MADLKASGHGANSQLNPIKKSKDLPILPRRHCVMLIACNEVNQCTQSCPQSEEETGSSSGSRLRTWKEHSHRLPVPSLPTRTLNSTLSKVAPIPDCFDCDSPNLSIVREEEVEEVKSPYCSAAARSSLESDIRDLVEAADLWIDVTRFSSMKPPSPVDEQGRSNC
jgi:hypothetical protein